MEDIVLETLMFNHPPCWGKRVIKRGNEIILQSTNNKGQTWKDEDPLEYSFYLPETQLRSSSINPYAGLVGRSKVQLRNSNSSGEEDIKLGPELQAIVDSGNLLELQEITQKDEKTGRVKTVETITFFGAMSYKSLSIGTVYHDEDGFLKVVI